MFRPIAFVVTALVVVTALWLFFKPQRLEPRAAESTAGAVVQVPAAAVAAPEQATAAPSPLPEVFELVIKQGRLVSGPAVIQVHEGEQVALRIRSDRGDELHLHGYDLHAQIRPGQTTRLEFTADRTGRFDLELHKANTQLAALEVYPR